MEQRFDVPLHFILDNPYQPRTTDNVEHIKSLALSIAADGLLQVPTARELNDGTYELQKAEALTKQCKSMGVKLPKSFLKLAVEFDAQIAAAGVAAETEA